MTTHIFDLTPLTFAMAVSNNEDWRDSWAYVDGQGNPLSLAGMALNFVLQATETGALLIIASTLVSVAGLPLNGKVAAGGTAGNVCGLNIPRATMQRLQPGIAYTHETQAQADGITKTIARGTVTVYRGANP